MIKVSQRNPTDCGVCCLAMLLKLPYEKVAQTVFVDYALRRDFSIRFEELKEILKSFGKEAEAYAAFGSGPAINGILEISYTEKGLEKWHYLVWDAAVQEFLDPRSIPFKGEFKKRRFVGVLR
jgi:hypothetical protein